MIEGQVVGFVTGRVVYQLGRMAGLVEAVTLVTIHKTQRVGLINLREVVVTQTCRYTQSLRDEVQILSQREISLERTGVALRETGSLNLCDHVVSAVGGVTTPNSCQFTFRVVHYRKCGSRSTIKQVGQTVFGHAVRTFGLYETAHCIQDELGRRSKLHVQVGTDTGFRESHL